MDKEIKKRLARNWFKLIQDVICFEIENLEKKNKKFFKKKWQRTPDKDEGSGEYRYLKNLERNLLILR